MLLHQLFGTISQDTCILTTLVMANPF